MHPPSKVIFICFQKQIWFFINQKSSFFFSSSFFFFFYNFYNFYNFIFFTLYKKDLIFLDKILLFTLHKNRYDFFFTNQVLFILIYKTNLIFLLKEDIIHKANLFDLFFFLSIVCHVFSTYHSTSCKKGILVIRVWKTRLCLGRMGA